MSCNIREGLLGCIDKILDIRDEMGALLAETHFVLRTWSGERPGDGTFTDIVTRLEPQPASIADLSHDIRLGQGGAYKQGDLLLKGISQNTYTEPDLLTQTHKKNVEKFIKVGDHYYVTVNIKKNLVTWDVQIRKILQDESERS